MPQLVADARSERAPRLLGAGSPVRYYAPIAPVAFGSLVPALLRGWRSAGDRRPVVGSAVCKVSAVALSAYLISSVNVRLLTSDEPLTEEERRKLVADWHLVNAVRLGFLAVSLASLSRMQRSGMP